uniref:Odorant receptor n=1 Tax=Glossina brevipalpis TaxID=37001 RepID=A0A1A9WQN6_9MUSC
MQKPFKEVFVKIGFSFVPIVMDNPSESVKILYSKQTLIFRIVSIWDLPENVGYYRRLAFAFYSWIVTIFLVAMFAILLIIKIFCDINNISEVIRVIFNLASSLTVLGKFLTVKMKNHLFRELFDLLHIADFLPKNLNEDKLFKKALQLSKTVLKLYGGMSLVSINITFLIQFLKGTRELPLPIYELIDTNVPWKYFIMYFYEYLGFGLCCVMNIAYDSLGAAFFIYIKGQLDILSERLEAIGYKSNSKQNQLQINKELKACAIYYDLILDLTHLMEELMCLPLSIQILCSVLVLIANFYVLSMIILAAGEEVLNFIRCFLYQCCMFAQIFILCYFANEVTLTSEKLSLAIYKANWVDWNKENRKLALQMMARLDLPIRIKTINRCYSFNLTAFTSIVNSSYSYFALLKNFN